MVLNMIICTAFKMLGYLGPAVAIDFMVLKDLIVLFDGPFHLFDVWIEVIVPSKKAIFVSYTGIGDFAR